MRRFGRAYFGAGRAVGTGNAVGTGRAGPGFLVGLVRQLETVVGVLHRVRVLRGGGLVARVGRVVRGHDLLILGELHHHFPQQDRGRALAEALLHELVVGVLGRGATVGSMMVRMGTWPFSFMPYATCEE
jgi:hypothetical protein